MGWQCAACSRIGGDTWTALRFEGARASGPDGSRLLDGDDDEDGDYDFLDLAYDEQPVSGFVPVCSWCVLVCPTCHRTVFTEQAHELVARHQHGEVRGARGEEIALDWTAEPCTDPGHERPASPELPHPAKVTPPYQPQPPRPRAVPGWSAVMQEWRGLSVGDSVIADGRGRHVGRVVSIASNRLSGGVYVVIRFPDGSTIRRRPGDLHRVIEPASNGSSPMPERPTDTPGANP